MFREKWEKWECGMWGVKCERVREGERADLTARAAAAVLPTLDEAAVPVDTYDALIELEPIEEAHGVLRTASLGVLDEAKATGRLVRVVDGRMELMGGWN